MNKTFGEVITVTMLPLKGHLSWVPLQAQECRSRTASQKGIHTPSRHSPLSRHTVWSAAFSGDGHSLLFPVGDKKQPT